MPELERRKETKKAEEYVRKTILDKQEKQLILSVLRSEIETSGLEGNYVRRLKSFEHKLTSFENIELSEEEKKLVVALMDAFTVLGGQRWSADKIYDLNCVYRNLGGREWLPDIWLFWKIISRRRRKKCPYCGQEIKEKAKIISFS